MARKYRKISCHTTKTAAKSKAKAMRSRGLTARVTGKCVYSAGKKKTSRIGRRRRKRA